MSIESVISSNHLILCHPLLLLPSISPSIRVFSNESVLHIKRPKYWSFTISISSCNEYSGLISFRMNWLDLLAVHKLKKKKKPSSLGLRIEKEVKLTASTGSSLLWWQKYSISWCDSGYRSVCICQFTCTLNRGTFYYTKKRTSVKMTLKWPCILR